MDVDAEIGKAALIMSRYGMTSEDGMTVIQTLLDAGIERCLQEQAKIRERNEEMISRAVSSKQYPVRPN
jgi:hypothetical protein